MSVLITLITSVYTTNAQNNIQKIATECGVTETTESLELYKKNEQKIIEFEQNLNSINKSNKFQNRNSTNSIPIKAHIVRRSDGTGGLSESDLNNAIIKMNTYFANSNMQFYTCDGINYINSDYYYDFAKSEEYALTSNNVNGLINIYFINSLINYGISLCGLAYYPGGPDTILMRNSCTSSGDTFSHEMGHFFRLRHTHGNSKVAGSTNELVNGANCSSEGGFLCDTPADPLLSYSNVSTSCVYTGTATDANGDTYAPDPENIMSYARHSCRDIFSPDQYNRMLANFQTTRNYFNCQTFSVDFISDNTFDCQNNTLTVNFTDDSIGATSWEWDVNGDNKVDYIIQNPRHTYTKGLYDVSLKISNTTTSITKTKSNYINVVSSKDVPLILDFDHLNTIETDDWRVTSTTNSPFVWALKSGGTSSSRTGPSGDNSDDKDGFYIYTEASGSNIDDASEYTSPCIEVNSTNAVLSFYYHMYGNNMGSLHFDIDSGAGFINDITPALNEQQQTTNEQSFIRKDIDLSPYTNQNIKIRFRALSGGTRSDIALDDIKIINTSSQADIKDFSFAEQTSKAIIDITKQSITVEVSSGTNITSLASLFTLSNGATATINGISQNSGITANNFTNSVTYSVTSANGSTSEDWVVKAQLQICKDIFPYTESFETADFYGLQNTDDDIDWTVNTGSTSSNRTGPSSAADGTYYLYIRANNNSYKTATFTTKCIDIKTLTHPELAFSYHMYGRDIN